MIDDATYEAALADPDNARVMARAARRYARTLSRQEREEAMQLGLLRCLDSFVPGRGQKFTTSLFRLTSWECWHAARDARRRRGRPELDGQDMDRFPDGGAAEARRLAREYLDLLGPEAALVEQRYFGRLSFREMGEANGCSHVAAWRRFHAAMGRLRELTKGDCDA